MKKIVLFIVFTSLIFVEIFAQNTVQFQINHKLGDNPFEYRAASTNNIGHDFKVRRLNYYVSKISIQHDNGMETLIPCLLYTSELPTNSSV